MSHPIEKAIEPRASDGYVPVHCNQLVFWAVADMVKSMGTDRCCRNGEWEFLWIISSFQVGI
jgi:hypothetical protein